MTDNESLSERLHAQTATRTVELIQSGLTEKDAVGRAVEELLTSFDERSEAIADGLARVTEEHLMERYDHDEGFRARLTERYRQAFTAYDVVVEVVAEGARDVWSRYRSQDDHDLLTEILWGNLVQCLRVAREVGHLLRGGFPFGALSAQRTAYELAVRSTVLKSHAREPAQEDLVERYQLHEQIGQEADVREYQRNAERLGFAVMDESEVQNAAARRAGLVARFGKDFTKQYGWAIGLPGVTAGQFRELEELAAVDHRRGFYCWASHYVHGDPSSLRMSIMRRGGASQGVISDATNLHLTDPAQLTLYALNLTYVSVAMGDPPDLADFWIAKGLPHLIDRAANAFWTAEQAIMADEKELQHQLSSERDAPDV